MKVIDWVEVGEGWLMAITQPVTGLRLFFNSFEVGIEMIRRIYYSIFDGSLFIYRVSFFQKTLIWKGKPLDLVVVKVIPLRKTKDAILLLNWEQAAQQGKKNIIRINALGEIVWEINSKYCFNNCFIWKKILFADYNYDTFAIDIETGEIKGLVPRT